MPTSSARSLSILSGGVRLSAYEWGSPQAPPLVAVHGIQDQAHSLEPTLRPLSERFRVLSFDLRGHSDSDHPGLYTLLHFLADLDSLLSELCDQPAVLLGHSLGGQIVSQYAAVHPERVRAVVSIEGLGPPASGMSFPRQHQLERARRSLVAVRQTGEARPLRSADEALEQFQAAHPRLDPREAKRLTLLGTTLRDGELYWKWDPRVLTALWTLDHGVIEQRWGWIESPLLLVTAELAHEFWEHRRRVGTESARIRPEELERRLRLFSGTSPVHVEIEDAGHMVHYDQPERLGKIVSDFLEDAAPELETTKPELPSQKPQSAERADRTNAKDRGRSDPP